MVVRATSGTDLARGCADYLRRHLNMSFAWARTGGHQTARRPSPGQPWPAAQLRGCRQTDVSYYQNVVASSYSHVWWSFEDWERFLDWAALSGINLMLA